ncbi:MAG: cytochrome C oxidase subunit IV family protein [Anaerolineae bacterium]|nr:cytochrome C oxidase subunit IV family protein [Anaerolineae bacterium]
MAAHEHTQAHEGEHAHPDTTVMFGRTFPFPIYTVIFGILAVVTLVEVIISELPDGWLGAALLIVLSVFKAALVVWYYMHLREDNRLYSLILIVPVLLVAVATLYLASVPLGGY